MYEQIDHNQFKTTMEKLQNKSVWLQFQTETISLDRLFKEFEFLSFLSERYQLGFTDYDEENEYKKLLIRQSDIIKIQRDIILPTINAEEIILTMRDGVRLFLQTENC